MSFSSQVLGYLYSHIAVPGIFLFIANDVVDVIPFVSILSSCEPLLHNKFHRVGQ